MTALRVREAERHEIPDLLALWRVTGIPEPPDHACDEIQESRQAQRRSLLVGTCGAAVVASILIGHDGRRGWLRHPAMHPNHAGETCARTMIAAGESWLAARNIPEVRLPGPPTDPNARRLYESLGYVPTPDAALAKRLDGRPAPDAKQRLSGPGSIATIVTYLEMTAPPNRPPAIPPERPPVVLARVEKPTVAYYRFLYNTVGADWTWVERRLMDDPTLQAAIAAPGVDIHVLYAGGAPAGYGELARNSEPNEVNLVYFGLMPDCIGKGLGRYFLDAVVDIAWSHRPERVWVHTCDLDHPRALDAYRRAGFAIYAQREERVPDPRIVGLPLPAGRTVQPA